MMISEMTWPQIAILVATSFALRALGLSIGGTLGRSRPVQRVLAVLPVALIVGVVVSLTVDIARTSPEPRPALAGIGLGIVAIGARLGFIPAFLIVVAGAVATGRLL